MDKNIKMKDIKELGEQLGELQRVCREKKIPVMIAFEGYVAFKDLNEDINLLAYIVMGLAVCHMFIKYKRRND